ncbi:MAG: tetratricopeptide repeat protein [Bryobacterales bacterium]|jgi:cytochrome c-type biogenesis protein CcmH/NrfG|nr:tetratricopeptide repeat protein [Bryobacterales bacterium]
MSTTATVLPENTLAEVIAGNQPLNVFLGLSPEQIQAFAVLGFSSYQQGRVAEAREIFEGLIAVDNSSYYGWAGLGAIELTEENLDAAEHNLRCAADRNGSDSTVMANLGEVYLRKGDTESAASFLQKALELDPLGEDPATNRARAILQGMMLVLDEMEKNPDLFAEESN